MVSSILSARRWRKRKQISQSDTRELAPAPPTCPDRLPNCPDIILLDINMPDINMPDMNGYDVCRQLETDERIRDISDSGNEQRPRAES